MGAVNQLLAKHGVSVRRGRVDIHRDQGIVERFNRTLAERLFGQQYAQEMRLPPGQRSIEWVARLPAVVATLNGEVTRLTGKMPKNAIKAMSVAQNPTSTIPGRQVGLKEQKLPSGVVVPYLYQPGELEGGRRCATDPVWSLQVYRLGRSVTKPDEPKVWGSQALENCRTSIFVTLEAGQPYVVTGMSFGIVQTVNGELLGILGLVSPEEFNIAGGTVVILGLFEMHDVIDLQVKPEPLGLVLALVGHEILCGVAARLLEQLA